MGFNMFSIVVTLIGLSLFQFTQATDEAGTEPGTVSTDNLSTKALERISRYETSIKYWDTADPDVRKVILKDLAAVAEVHTPGCPRIRYPLICDQDGEILENVCYFRMKRHTRAALLPIMIFTTTPIDQAQYKCKREHARL